MRKLGPIKPVRGLRRMSGPMRFKPGMNARAFANVLDKMARQKDIEAGLKPPPRVNPRKPKKPKP